MKKKIWSYVIAIAIPLAVGGLSALLTKDSMDIYMSIVQPPLSPPGILFPIVWTILYILMGVSSAMIYNADCANKQKIETLFLYALQLVVNFFWSIVFFNQRLFLASFVLLIFLWILIIAMIYKFWKIYKLAAWLQLPYLLWVTFAGYLNLAIYLLN